MPPEIEEADSRGHFAQTRRPPARDRHPRLKGRETYRGTVDSPSGIRVIHEVNRLFVVAHLPSDIRRLLFARDVILRPIRRFCFRRSRPCYPNSFGTGSHPPRKIGASAFAPEPERIGNVDVAVASTARTTWQSLQTRLTVRPPCGASSQFSARALSGLDQSHCCHRPTEPRRGADPRRATPLLLANELFSKSLHQIMRRRDSAYI